MPHTVVTVPSVQDYHVRTKCCLFSEGLRGLRMRTDGQLYCNVPATVGLLLLLLWSKN